MSLADASAATTRPMRLTAVEYGAEGSYLCVFKTLDGSQVLPFECGAHVDLHLPNGQVRQYSLANDPCERDRYVLGIKRDAASRGGSRFVHEELRVGAVLQIGRPRNNFALDERATHTVFLAGGIGITPIRSMIHRAEAIGMSWELHYAVRRREEALFAAGFEGDLRVHLHIDEEAGSFFQIDAIVPHIAPTASLYCCGPSAMLEAFSKAFEKWPQERRHVEYFSAPKSDPQPGGAFRIVLARSNRELAVDADQTILDVVRAAGVHAEASCEQGICGSCEVRVLSGTPDHRDILLSPQEREEGKSMMICCSRSKTSELILDL